MGNWRGASPRTVWLETRLPDAHDRQAHPVIKALHVGPHEYSFGGTQSVIRTIREESIGADEVTTLASWDGPGAVRSLRLVAAAARAIRSLNPDTIVHLHITSGGAWAREGMLIRTAQRRGLRIVVTLHGFNLVEFAQAHPRLVRSVLKPAGHIICLSEDAREIVTGIVGTPNVTVLANPIAIDDESPPASETEAVVLFAGTIGHRKGVDVLVESWKLLRQRGVPGRCRIVGEIDDFTPPPVDGLTVEEPIHPDEMRDLLRSVRVVALPSRAEGMPMILTEALAAARPFVATPVGGTRDITPDQEMIVPVGDPASLADALAQYLQDPEFAATAGRRGQQYVMETRSPAVIDKNLRAIYATI